jgi:peptidoglycan hydrolase-like protein with peptidoglycan-binding domain
MTLTFLQIGDSNNQYVMLLQRFLVLNDVLRRNSSGQDPVTGEFNSDTQTAVEKLQQLKGFAKVDGKVGEKTWAAIAGVNELKTIDESNPPPTILTELKLGNTDPLVTVLQRLLLDYSETPLSGIFFVTTDLTQQDIIDGSGYFSDKTQQAVKSFQVAVNKYDTKNPTPPLPSLALDGEVDANTWHRLIFPKKV